MQWLKLSTAVSKIVGPILDSAGAEYASAVIGDLSISKNGATLTALASAATLTYIANGYYTLALTTGNTDTLGSAEVSCNKSTYQMPPREFMVLPATVYDALVTNATTATGGLGDIQRMAGTALTARDIGASVLLSSGTGTGQLKLASGYVAMTWADVAAPTTTVDLSGTTIKTTQKVDVDTIKTNPVVNGGTITFPTTATLASTTNITAGTVTTATNVTTVNGLAANVITATSIASDAITAAKIADGAIDTATFASGTTIPRVTLADTVTTLTNLPTIPANWLTAAGTAADFTTEIQTGLATAASIAALNNLSAAQVNAEADAALSDVGLTTTITGRIDAAVSSRMATYTQPTGFLAATFPTTVASTTNITAGTITTVTNLTNAPTAGDLTTAMKASVNAEVVDCLNVDTYGEIGQESPAATNTIRKMLGFLFKAWRNKKLQTSTQLSLMADDGTTVDQKATVSDDGTTTSVGEIATGP